MSKRTLAVLICVSLSAGIRCATATPDGAPQSAPVPAVTSRDATTSPTVKTILVVPLAFPGHRADPETIRSRYGELLPGYIWAVSNGRLKVDVTITPWISMPHPISEYRLGSSRIRATATSTRPPRPSSRTSSP